MNNGDLWRIVHRILGIRGAHSVAFSWVRGHLLEQVPRPTLEPDMLYKATHNQMSDEIAKEAYGLMYNKNLLDLSKMIQE
eukprot:8754569-Karenia_brevis.AAC.1